MENGRAPKLKENRDHDSPTVDRLNRDLKTLAAGAGTALFGGAFGKGLFFLSQVLLARTLGIEAFGLYGLGLAALRISETVARLGLNTGGMRFVSVYYNSHNKRALKGVLVSTIIVTFASGLFFGSLAYLLANHIASHLFHRPDLSNTLKLFALSTPLVAGMTVVDSLMQGFRTLKYTVFVRDLVQPLSHLILIGIACAADLGLQAYILAFATSHLLAFAVGLACTRRLFPGLTDGTITPTFEIKRLLIYSLPLLFLSLIQYLLAWIDTLMLGIFGSVGGVGVYRAASQLPMMMSLFLMASNSIYAPVAAALAESNELYRLERTLKTTTRWVTNAAIPLFLVLAFASRDLMYLFGEEYVEIGRNVMLILASGQLVNCMAGGVGFTLTMSRRQNFVLINSLVVLLISVGMNYLLIPKYGPVGAAISQAAALSLMNVLALVEVYATFKFHPIDPSLGRLLIPTSTCIILISLFSRYVELANPLLRSGAMATLVLSCFGAYTALNAAEEDRYVLSQIKAFLKKRTQRLP